MNHLDKKEEKTLFHIKNDTSKHRKNTHTHTHTHVGLLVVVHRLDKNEITKVITHYKNRKQKILFFSTNSAYPKKKVNKNKNSLTKSPLNLLDFAFFPSNISFVVKSSCFEFVRFAEY